MTDTITYTLTRPIEHNGQRITSLAFREATAGDACLADAVTGNTRRLLAMLSGMCGQPLPVLEKISLRDLTVLSEKVSHLLGEPSGSAGPTQ